MFLIACAPRVPPKPVLILHPQPLADGGRIVRDLYRSFWIPPASDQELVRIGLHLSQPSLRFRALKPLRIRALGEFSGWDVASPAGVIWRAEFTGWVRPPMVAYFATVDSLLRQDGAPLPENKLGPWRNRGFTSARWFGPPEMDEEVGRPAPMERWFLAVTPPTGKKTAEGTCRKVRSVFKHRCDVIGRIDLPPVGRGILYAENGTFQKRFTGLLEILSPRGPVELLGFVRDSVSGDRASERFGPRLFLLPNLPGELSLVQSTSLGNYLEGVVPGETFASAPAPALQAQAVIARTYAIRHMKSEYSLRPFSICGDVRCQVYRGIDHKNPKTSRAVAETANMILWDRSVQPAEAFYHSMCGGHTEPRQAIWGGANSPHLGGVSDQRGGQRFVALRSEEAVRGYLSGPPTSFCGTSTFTVPERWRWKVTLEKKEIARLLGELGLRPPLLDLRPRRRGISGRLLRLEFVTPTGRKSVSGELRIRKLLGGIRSSLFSWVAEKEGKGISRLEIHGGGYGHGVGLCQVGAIGRAEAGQLYPDILEAYYPGTKLAPIQAPVVP